MKIEKNETIIQMGVSENRGTPKSSILIGFSIINHPFWGIPIFGNTQIMILSFLDLRGGPCKTAVDGRNPAPTS